ncbi:MAG TPA: hypothetical protein VFH11_14140, partial [Gemmatimonadota bacterium]|nr:hypothetical protein [Gemmatimonadota bacterium]
KMRRTTLGACTCALAILMSFGYAQAQQQDSPMRYVTVTTFDVPYGPDRPKVMAFLNEYFLPATQLHPNVRNFRLLTHVWGSDGMQVIMQAEYDNWADIEADCGQPCDDYFDQHAAPTVGEDGYVEYQEMSDLFNKAYSSHTDEIYLTNMDRAMVEGKTPNWVGPTPAASGVASGN